MNRRIVRWVVFLALYLPFSVCLDIFIWHAAGWVAAVRHGCMIGGESLASHEARMRSFELRMHIAAWCCLAALAVPIVVALVVIKRRLSGQKPAEKAG
jgi:hypothetical protein